MTKRAFFGPLAGASAGRRRVLLGALLGCLGSMGRASRAAARGAPRDSAVPALGGAFADPQAMAEVGALYLSAHPEEADATALMRALRGNGDGLDNHAIVRQIAGDWRQQQTVLISGWVFARTEARMCAWMHLNGAAA